MKPLLLFIVVISFLGSVSCIINCDDVTPSVPTEWLTMEESCQKKMREQVQEELKAAMTYMAMGAHFSKYDVNRPGFAKYFFESASEEREHAIKIISYLLMRTNLGNDIPDLIQSPQPQGTPSDWDNGTLALEHALQLETKVTALIRDIIIDCEDGKDKDNKRTGFNDYHLVDYLSGDFLDEQYKGQRQLAGMISTLKKMQDAQGVLGEYLFDKKLLNNELF